MDSARALMAAAQLRLKGELASLVGTRVYGAVPNKPTYPFVLITCQSAPFASDSFSGMEHTLRIQAFAREDKPATVLAIREAVFAAINRQEAQLALPNNQLVMIEHDGLADYFPEEDGRTYQSVIEFKALVI